MSSRCYFTVVTPSFLAQACVLMQSLHDGYFCKNNDKVEFCIFVLGARKRLDTVFPKISKLYYVEEEIDTKTIAFITSKYTPSESCWAFKPILMMKLIEDFDKVFYFDSDIFFYGDLSATEAELGDFNVLLTPHYLNEYPCDGRSPNDLTLLRGGLFNAGFLGVKNTNESKRFLQWWTQKVLSFGRNDPNNGMCGDQKWLDLAPILFNGVAVCRHYGFNVAYWNIHERCLESKSNKYVCNNGKEDLVFFHFSGLDFNVKHDDKLSKHSDRINVERDLWKLTQNYIISIRKAKSTLETFDNRYKYARWWHKNPKLYRAFTDIFNNPRKCAAKK